MKRSKLDEAILATARDEWCKVAFIIATIAHARDDHANEDDYNLIASRIAELVKEGWLECHGDLSDWRHSEVRLVSH